MNKSEFPSFKSEWEQYFRFVVGVVFATTNKNLSLLQKLSVVAERDFLGQSYEKLTCDEPPAAGRSEQVAWLKKVIERLESVSIFRPFGPLFKLESELLHSRQIQEILEEISRIRRRAYQHAEFCIGNYENRPQAVFRRVNLVELLHMVVDQETALFPREVGMCELRISRNSEQFEIDVDHVRMLTAMRNLLRNAVFSTLVLGKENPPRISPRSSKSLISIDVHKVDGAISVRFFDNGVGIEEKSLPFVGNYGYTHDTDGVSTQRSGGFGIATAKLTIAEHGGAFKISSRPGEGTKVELTFPL